MNGAAIEQVIDCAYAGALAPERWPEFLARLARLMHCHFADSFARAEDYSWFSGIAHGLDDDDYQDLFLGQWVKRNVWGKRRPVRVAGEIVTTREIISRSELLRSDMHREYLGPRDLDEGLRLAVGTEQGRIQDISLIRSWSVGPFANEEIAAARVILPHLQRCAAVANRLGEAQGRARAAEAGLEALRHAVVVLDQDGRAIHWNNAAERLLAARDGLELEAGQLRASERGAADRLASAVRNSVGSRQRKARSSAVTLRRSSADRPLGLTLLPIVPERSWTFARQPAALVVVNHPVEPAAPDARGLAEMFGLTQAEAEVSRAMASGSSPHEIATRTDRSLHTVRALLARAMRKTQTHRQSDLVRLLLTLPGT